LLSITLVLIIFTYCSENLSGLDKIGNGSNDKINSVASVAYGKAKITTDQYFINNQKGYSTPKYIAKLPAREAIKGGKIVSITELPSEIDYYDGSRKLRVDSITCNQWTTIPELCMKQSSCGWCGSSNTCIPGNNLGALAPCLAGKFFFSAPDQNFNLLSHNNYSITRKSVGGAQLTTLVDNNK